MLTLYSCRLAAVGFWCQTRISTYHRRYIILALDVQLPTTTSSQHSNLMSVIYYFPVFFFFLLKGQLALAQNSYYLFCIHQALLKLLLDIQYLRVTLTTESCSEERQHKRKTVKFGTSFKATHDDGSFF